MSKAEKNTTQHIAHEMKEGINRYLAISTVEGGRVAVIGRDW